MTIKTVLISIAAGIAGISAANATPIDSATSGIENPTQTIDFSEIAGLTQGEAITDQYEGLGVTFSPNLYFRTQFSGRDNQETPALSTFGDGDLITEFSILFDSAVSAASFVLSVNFGTATFTALNDGVVVSTFMSANSSNPPLFYGFEGIIFDEIRIAVGGNGFAIIDNIAFNSEVPLPAALPLFLAGIAGLGFAGRRRKPAVVAA